jgi:murein DD-endopeptidase MepM/ murein hydrolase activator NlpD
MPARARSIARPAAEPPAARPASGRPHEAGALLIPVQGVVAADLRDDFNQPRSDGRTHEALDILAPHGTPVLAAVDGTIRKLFFSGAGGITIYQFDRAEERVYYYAHLDRYADGLAEGLFVPQGTVIGYVGATGNAHGTNHLHFAIDVLPPTKEWWKGTPIDPYPLLATTRLSALP